jgi:hypothetical protein
MGIEKTQRLSSKDIRQLVVNLRVWANNCHTYENQHRMGPNADWAKSEYHRGAREAYERVLSRVTQLCADNKRADTIKLLKKGANHASTNA